MLPHARLRTGIGKSLLFVYVITFSVACLKNKINACWHQKKYKLEGRSLVVACSGDIESVESGRNG
jgi:hypothetical protein